MELDAVSFQRVSDAYRRAVEGHVYIESTFEALFEAVGRHVRRLGPKSRVLELGSHAGFVTESLLQRWPELEIVVNDADEALVSLAKRRLAERKVRFDGRPLDALTERFDLVLSVAKHHHLAHGYLPAVRRLLRPDSVYVLADELCPEYCSEQELACIERAAVLRIAGGFVFTSEADFEAFEKTGVVPEAVQKLEDARRRALWSWYRFVVDQAVERGYFDVAAGELQSARDNLVTGSQAEHKFGPAIVEREFSLAGFRQLEKRLVGPVDEPERQSMFVYEYCRA